MGRSPCCSKEGLNRGAWTAEEDRTLTDYITTHGEGKWRNLPLRAGLKRCGKSCRLRWLNYLRPDIKRGNIAPDEEDLIIRLHKLLGNRWSLIAGRLPGRTDNEIKNYWNTNLAKKVKHQNTPLVSPSPPNYNVNLDSSSHVIRTKATKCSKLLLHINNPVLPHEPDDHSQSSMQFPNNSNYRAGAKAEAEAEALPVGAATAANNRSCNQLMEPSTHDIEGFSSFDSEGIKELSTDLTDLAFDDFEMQGHMMNLPDLLNFDFNFSHLCDFSYNNNINNISHELSLPACSDQVPLLFPDEALHDWTTVPNYNNIQSSSTWESLGE